jgi:uncharacterized protein (TIGR01777 family)
MRIAVTGASGLIGGALVPALAAQGHEVLRLVRREARAAGEVRWDPATGSIDRPSLEGLDSVVHLAGENIAAGRWTQTRKARLRSSRVGPTRLLAETLATLERKPRVLVSASAIGCYGDRGDSWLTEKEPPADDFLGRLSVEWEASAGPAAQAGIRVVHPRTGIVLSPSGGALAKMLPPFRLGLGGVLGSGAQFFSWIALDDVVGAIGHLLERGDLAGPVNVVAPVPVTNAEFTKTLGRVLGRPTVLPVPAVALRLALGEMADAVLASARVRPERLVATGYRFRFPELEDALRHVLRRPGTPPAFPA